VAFLWTIFTTLFNIVSHHATTFRHIDTNANLSAGMMNGMVSGAMFGTHRYIYLRGGSGNKHHACNRNDKTGC
jgi:hypothetical protein